MVEADAPSPPITHQLLRTNPWSPGGLSMHLKLIIGHKGLAAKTKMLLIFTLDLISLVSGVNTLPSISPLSISKTTARHIDDIWFCFVVSSIYVDLTRLDLNIH